MTPIASDPKAFEAVQPPEYYRPCGNDGEDRKSDLCAQWTAAHGAEDAAFWAKLGFWLGLLGLGGLLATLYYTRAAVKVAQAATKDADKALSIAQKNADAAARHVEIASKASETQLRAYLAVTVIRTEKMEAGTLLRVSMEFKNTGMTPARDIHAQGGVTVAISKRTDGLFTPEIEMQQYNSGWELAAGEDISLCLETRAAIDSGKLSQIESETAQIFARLHVTYADVFGHQRESCFLYRSADGGVTYNPHGGKRQNKST